MSVHVSSMVYRAKFGSTARKAVAMKLADCAHDDGTHIWPSVASIAAEAEVSKRTVQRTLREFVEDGLLEVVSEGGRGPRDTTEYRFHLDKLQALPRVEKGARASPKKDDRKSSIMRAKGATRDNKGATVSLKGATVAPEPSLTVIEPLVSTPQPPKGGGPSPRDALEAFNAFNAVALRCGLPQAKTLSPARQRKIIARLRVYGLGGWTVALANLEKSAFLLGQTDKDFRADLDFICQAKSFDRLHDGGYGSGARARGSAAPATTKLSDEMRRLQAIVGGAP